MRADSTHSGLQNEFSRDQGVYDVRLYLSERSERGTHTHTFHVPEEAWDIGNSGSEREK